ncbi:MAG TPA: DUF3347 domain-containing protein [Chitinophagaceae bacterium]|nr:DUF3347 domain-containing protein [Chitinophagaceae bacterium]
MKYLAVYFAFFLLMTIFSCAEKKGKVQPEPAGASRHSTGFNRTVEQLLTHYFSLSEALVNWDTAAVAAHAGALKSSLDSFALDELRPDSVMHARALEPLLNARVEMGSIVADPSLDEKRASFNLLSDNLRSFLSAIRFDSYSLYWQVCPMAFDDTRPGYWLSRVDSIRNPYLGTKHPKYGKGMLACGETQEVLDFRATPK